MAEKGVMAIRAPGPITQLFIYRTRSCSVGEKPIGAMVRHKLAPSRWENAKLCSQLCVEDASQNRFFLGKISWHQEGGEGTADCIRV